MALQWRRRHYAVRFTNVDLLDKIAPKRPGWRRHLVACAFLLTGAFQVVAFAGPQTMSRIPRERATVMLAIDVSLSMDATDVEPSRIEGAKEAALSFLDTVPPKINIGLVSFNSRAIILVPPSTDRDRVRTAINNLTLGNGTAIGDAILSSLEALKAAPPDEQGTQPPAAIVLLSDGKTTVGTPDSEAARIAAEAGVPVSTIAFGTRRRTHPQPRTGTFISVPVDGARRASESPLGSGALASTGLPIDSWAARPRTWASAAPPATAWTRSRIATSPPSWCSPAR